jgi:hypothetical protein
MLMPKKDKRRPDRPAAPDLKGRPAPDVPEPGKRRPRRLQGVEGSGPDGSHPIWRLALLDLEHLGSWSWDVGADDLKKIIQFLREMEQLTWAEVRGMLTGGYRRRGPKHKFIPADHLCPEAQRRLVELDLQEFADLFRFRLGNMERLWGAVNEGIFYPVWWDPRHHVCPSKDPD